MDIYTWMVEQEQDLLYLVEQAYGSNEMAKRVTARQAAAAYMRQESQMVRETRHITITFGRSYGAYTASGAFDEETETRKLGFNNSFGELKHHLSRRYANVTWGERPE